MDLERARHKPGRKRDRLLRGGWIAWGMLPEYDALTTEDRAWLGAHFRLAAWPVVSAPLQQKRPATPVKG